MACPLAVRARGRRPASLIVLRVAPRVFRAPFTPVGPGVLMVRSARRFNVRLGLAAASLISHVIPLCLIQTLNLHCWNCNVFEVSRKMTTINYVRNVGAVVSLLPAGTAARPRRPLGPRLGAAGEAARWSETGVAFARLRLRGIETAIAFVGEKWAFLEWFSVAEVMVVSTVAVWGRALVMVVSCWPASVAAEVLLVSMAAVEG